MLARIAWGSQTRSVSQEDELSDEVEVDAAVELPPRLSGRGVGKRALGRSGTTRRGCGGPDCRIVRFRYLDQNLLFPSPILTGLARPASRADGTEALRGHPNVWYHEEQASTAADGWAKEATRRGDRRRGCAAN